MFLLVISMPDYLAEWNAFYTVRKFVVENSIIFPGEVSFARVVLFSKNNYVLVSLKKTFYECPKFPSETDFADFLLNQRQLKYVRSTLITVYVKIGVSIFGNTILFRKVHHFAGFQTPKVKKAGYGNAQPFLFKA